MPRIEQVLEPIPVDQRHVRFSFGCSETGYVARAVLTLPTGNVVARTSAPVADHRAAVDQVVDKLAAELRKHVNQTRHEELERRRRRRGRDFASADPHLGAMRGEGDLEGFFDLLRPLLRQLRCHARRELIIAQLEGVIPPGQLDVGDVLDEVLVRAWDRWPQRPRNVPLERWLVQLLHEFFDEHGFRSPDEGRARTAGQRGADGAPTVSIYERLRDDEARHVEEPDNPAHEINPDSPYAAEDGWAVENNPNWPFVDSLTRDDVLPDDEAPEPWQTLAAEEERHVILDELERFARDQRRALALHVLDGWTIDEIAEAQERAAGEVARDIEAGRRALRRRLSRVADRSVAELPS